MHPFLKRNTKKKSGIDIHMHPKRNRLTRCESIFFTSSVACVLNLIYLVYSNFDDPDMTYKAITFFIDNPHVKMPNTCSKLQIAPYLIVLNM